MSSGAGFHILLLCDRLAEQRENHDAEPLARHIHRRIGLLWLYLLAAANDTNISASADCQYKWACSSGIKCVYSRAGWRFRGAGISGNGDKRIGILLG